jgi:DNA-binding response OmpR family regulator
LLAGADASLPCPVRPSALANYLAARISTTTLHMLAHGWQLDEEARQIRHPEHGAIALTEKEAQVIAHLAQSLPQACPRAALLQEIWGHSAALETHTLETHVYRLRGKFAAIQPKPCDIVTEDGAYRLVLA